VKSAYLLRDYALFVYFSSEESHMKIVGNRVILRTIEEQDQEMLLSLIKDPEIAKVTGGYSGPISYGHQMNWFRSLPDFPGDLRGIIADKKHPEIGLGIILLSHGNSQKGASEIYIKLRKSVRGKGYGQDAINVLVSYAFCELQLNCIYSNILEYNMASRRLFEKCGFQLEKMDKSRFEQDGNYAKVCSYKIVSSTWSDRMRKICI
jgi:RimJ/RimL family protein N-acetyltransferase